MNRYDGYKCIMKRYTKTEIIEQEKRFNELLKKVNFLKLGKKMTKYHKDINYQFIFIHRYLRLNKINGDMYKPNTTSFYHEILMRKVFNILFVNSTLKKEVK